MIIFCIYQITKCYHIVFTYFFIHCMQLLETFKSHMWLQCVACIVLPLDNTVEEPSLFSFLGR